MGRQRMVNTDFWTDTWVVDTLNPLDRYLFMYLFTNPHTNVAGVYELSLRIMSFETGLETQQLQTMLRDLEPKVMYKDGWVVLRNSIKNQNYKSPLMHKAIQTHFDAAPSEILQHVSIPKDFGKINKNGPTQTKLLDTVSTGYTYHGANNNNNNNNNNKAATQPRVPKGTYRAAVKADERLAKKETEARERKAGGDTASGYELAKRKVAEIKKRTSK